MCSYRGRLLSHLTSVCRKWLTIHSLHFGTCRKYRLSVHDGMTQSSGPYFYSFLIILTSYSAKQLTVVSTMQHYAIRVSVLINDQSALVEGPRRHVSMPVECVQLHIVEVKPFVFSRQPWTSRCLWGMVDTIMQKKFHSHILDNSRFTSSKTRQRSQIVVVNVGFLFR